MIANLAALAIFSSLSLNLVLQCGLGMRLVAVPREGEDYSPFLQAALLFSAVLLLWLIFSYIFAPLFPGVLVYIFVFPLGALVFFSLECLVLRFSPGKNLLRHSSSFCDALSGASLFVTLNLASGFVEAAVLSAGFAAGLLLARLILAELRRRSTMEAVPCFLRGSPLILISMGLLSLIFSSAAVVLYRVIGFVGE
jgi:electron transport complex protein RnfA